MSWSKLYAFIAIGAMMFLFGFFQTGVVVHADDDEYEYEEEHEEEGSEFAEEGGGVIGWGAIVFAGAAGLLLPARRTAPKLMRKFPEQKKMMVNGLRYLGKFHIMVGLGAVAAASAHGIMMYLYEGELGTREWLGIVAVASMGIAGVVGAVLAKNKRSKAIRGLHITLLIIAAAFVAVHLLLS